MKQRLLTIQVLRALAFVMVFLSHVELTPTGPIGVSLFLLMSGFCMTYSYIDKGNKTPMASLNNNFIFAVRKIKKLYPLHIVILIFVATFVFVGLLIHKSNAEKIGEQLFYFLANGLLIQSWIPWKEGYFSFNAVSWYLSTIAFLYFIFPWIFRIIQSKKNKKIFALVIITTSVMIITSVILDFAQRMLGLSNQLSKWFTYVFPLYRAGDFIIGLALGYLFVTKRNKQINCIKCTLVECITIVIVILQIIVYGSGYIKTTSYMLSLFWLPTSAVLIYFFSLNNGIVSKALVKIKALYWIGNISAEAFLIHQICIKATMFVTKNKCLIAIIAFLITIIATVAWRKLYSRFIMCKNEK